MRRLVKAATTLMISSLVFGCAATSYIQTDPGGADIYIDGVYYGESPVAYGYRSGRPSVSHVSIEKQGYRKVDQTPIRKVYRADVQLLWLIPGVFPYFWGTARFEDEYRFVLKQETLVPPPKSETQPPRDGSDSGTSMETRE